MLKVAKIILVLIGILAIAYLLYIMALFIINF